MTEGEIRQRVQSAILDKRGPDLILSLVEEIANLNIRMELALRQIQALRSFESLKDHLITIDTTRTIDPRPATLKLDASQLLSPSDGFYHLEYSVEGVPYRWTGPSREFSFNVFVSRTRPVDLALRATRLMDPKLQSAFILIADGDPMNMEFAEEGEKWVARTVLPARTDLGATHLTVVLPSIGRPLDSPDTRTLGIAFHDLEMRPRMDIAEPVLAPAPMSNGSAPADPNGSAPGNSNASTLSALREPKRRQKAAASGGGRAELKTPSD